MTTTEQVPTTGTHVSVSTRRRDEAPALLARTFPGLRLELPRSGDDFVFRHSSFGDARLRSSELIVSGPAAAHGTLPTGTIAVGDVLAGRAESEAARRVDTTLPFLRPAGVSTLRLHDVHLRLVQLDAAAVHALAERVEEVGGPRLRLVRTRPVSPAAVAAWRWAADQVHATLRDPRAVASPLVADELFELAARMLLRCFADVVEAADAATAAAPAAVRRAVAYLEEHAAEGVSMPEVAAAARVSVRSLQALFRRHLDASPLEHLHAIRLEAARRELLAADAPDGPRSVQEVAVRWGFGNSGRFARIYTARFGERPSDTFRRAR